jgi:3-deoxy-D-manno-octulosonic-acid transferase
MRTVYNLLFTTFFWLSAPYYFLKMWRRGNWQAGFRQRFGRFSAKVKQAVTNRHVIWLHAVSVGEVGVCTQLIRALEARAPSLKIVVSTTTSTGMAELRRRLPPHIEKIYYPIDRRKYVARALAAVHPQAIVLVEGEIWPNFLWQARRRGIPVFLVNARLSERSYRGYKRFGFLFHRFFRHFAGVGAQNEADAMKLRELGCRPEAIRVVGSMKFDAARLDPQRLLDVPSMLQQLGWPANARLLVGGSTHAGEEALLAEVFLRLRQEHPDLFLIVVPRHFERGKEAGRDIAARGVRLVFRSTITPSSGYPAGTMDCLLVNTTGELKYFYEQATVIFVGKSLAAHGGQNPIEPGSLGKAMVFGPNMENFAAIATAFVKGNGAIQVRNAAELEKAVSQLLKDAKLREVLGRNALSVVRENQGAVERTVEMVIASLRDEHLNR